MLKDISPRSGVGTVSRARRSRREMTLPEVLLWQVLKARPGGPKFRRQHPSGPYVLDFYCSDARLAVEIDGLAHDRGDKPQRDAARDAYFAQAGIETVRIPATDVLADPARVADGIIAVVRGKLPLHHPAGGPPPRD